MFERVLIAGLGSIGKKHLSLMRELLPNADIRILRHKACRETIKHSNGCFDDQYEATKYNPQIAVIANPAPLHLPIAEKLVEIGCHLLIEKPLSDDLDAAVSFSNQKLINQVKIQLAYNLRFDRALNFFKNSLSEKIIGNIFSIRCEVGQYLPQWRPNTDYRDSVSARKSLGGGVLLELSHEIDYLRWLFGDISSVSAHIDKHSDLRIDVEDSAYLRLNFTKDYNNAFPVAVVSMDFIRHDQTRTCTVIGSDGSIRWNGVKNKVELWKINGRKWETIYQDKIDDGGSYKAQLESFFSTIIDNKKPKITIQDGIEALKVIQAARSSDSNQGLTVPVNRR